MTLPSSQHKLQDKLLQITQLLEKQRLVEALIHGQEGRRQELVEALVHRQHLVELQGKLARLHPADAAYILEALTPEQRLLVWRQIGQRRGDILLELAPEVRETLLVDMSRDELLAALAALDADDLTALAGQIPADVLDEVTQSLNVRERRWLESSLAYPERSVGHFMSYEMVTVRETSTLEQVLQELRGYRELPPQTDKLFVIDGRHVFKGVLPLQTLLLNPPREWVGAVMRVEVETFAPEEDAAQAAQAFERYDLVSAPVIDGRGKLVGRLTVDAVMDYIRAESSEEALSMAGLSGAEDLFAPVWASARNRWLWLSINLVTAFLASRVIGLFTGTIDHLVALATLMPIVAGIGGNTGNQTIALVIRGIALGQIRAGSTLHLIVKELGVSLLNGIVWGGVMGLAAYALYRNPALGLVMMAAMLLNLIAAALVGVLVPLTLQKLGRDPALGASVLLTFATDSMGFLIFLGLATLFLL